MIVGIKDIFKLIGIIIIAACAVFVCTLFLNYNIDLQNIEGQINSVQIKAMYDAQLMTGKVVSIVSGGCLLITSVIMLCFYIKNYIDSHRKELGILKALGYSDFKIARGFWVFGFSVFIGAVSGFAGAYLLMPRFYAVQNEDKLLPDFQRAFHIILPLCLVILPALVFALLSVFYAVIKIKSPVIDLLKGKSSIKIKEAKGRDDLPFLKDMRIISVKAKKSLVFFIGFAAFCYSAMVQMSLGMKELSSEVMALMTLMIGLVLAFVTLFIAVTTIVNYNKKSLCIMQAFGYSAKDCSAAVLNGYRPAALIGFGVGTVYQYALLKIAVEVLFKDIDNIPDFNFDFKALVIAFISFAIIYLAVMYFYGRKIRKLSVKKIMLDSE